MWNPRVHLAVAMLACALMAAEARQPAPAPSTVVNGLQLSISHDDAAQGSVKTLQFVHKCEYYFRGGPLTCFQLRWKFTSTWSAILINGMPLFMP